MPSRLLFGLAIDRHDFPISFGCLTSAVVFLFPYANSARLDLANYLACLKSAAAIGETATGVWQSTDQIWAEPGRSIVGDSVFLLATVIGRQQREIDSSTRSTMAFMVPSRGRLLQSHQFRFYSLSNASSIDPNDREWCKAIRFCDGWHSDGREHMRELYPSMIVGPSCDGGDIVAENLWMPRLHRGDLIAVPNMGAYCQVTATAFNGLPMAKVLWLSSRTESSSENLLHRWRCLV